MIMGNGKHHRWIQITCSVFGMMSVNHLLQHISKMKIFSGSIFQIRQRWVSGIHIFRSKIYKWNLKIFQQRRSKRSNPPSKLKSMHHDRISHHVNPLINKNLHASPAQSCQRYGLYVSFKDLQWEWIIAPQGYGAFYCGGECGFPAPHNVQYTNHAIIQTLAHLMQSSDIPKPCCAPTKLSSISVLYIPKETSVHLRKYPKMVAKSCGCQWNCSKKFQNK